MVPTLHRADTTAPAHFHVITVIIIIHAQLAAAIIILKTVISTVKSYFSIPSNRFHISKTHLHYLFSLHHRAILNTRNKGERGAA